MNDEESKHLGSLIVGRDYSSNPMGHSQPQVYDARGLRIQCRVGEYPSQDKGQDRCTVIRPHRKDPAVGGHTREEVPEVANLWLRAKTGDPKKNVWEDVAKKMR